MKDEQKKYTYSAPAALPEDDFPPERASERRVRRRRLWRRLRWLLWLLLLVPFIYMVVQIFIIMAPQLQYETAFLDTMTDAMAVRGLVVQSAVQVTGGNGLLYYTVPVGERVAAGTEVAREFASEQALQAMTDLDTVERELALLAEAQSATAEGGDLDGLLNQMQAGLYGLLGELETGTYGRLNEARQTFAVAANKLQVTTGQAVDFATRVAQLEARKTALEQQAVPTGSVTAPQNGYFVPSGRQDRLMVNPEAAQELTAQQLQAMLDAEPLYYGTEVAGHIITDYRWRFYTVVEAGQAERFVAGDRSLTLRFPDAGGATVPVQVESVAVDEAAGLARVVLYCEYTGAETMRLRSERAEVIFGEKKGILIDRNALRLVDEVDDDGVATTYRGVYVKFGNMVYFRKVDILLEDEFYMLVPEATLEGVNEVQLYDEIVVDAGGVELYDRKIL